MNQTYTMRKDQEELPIKKVESEKDLGVIIDNKLTFTKHINSKIKIANRNLGLIFRTFTCIDKEIFLNLFKSLVRPHLEYASTVWCPVFKKNRVANENVQRLATKLATSISHLPYSERLRAFLFLFVKRLLSNLNIMSLMAVKKRKSGITFVRI